MGVFTLTITKSDSIKDEYTNTLKLLIFMLYYAYFKQMYGNPINEHLFDQINTIEDSPSFNITILKILKGIMNTSYDNESLISDIANQILNALNKELDFSSIIEEFLGYLKLYITEQEDIIKYEEDQIKLTQNLHFEEYNYIILALASINYYIDTENNYLLSMLQFNSTIEQNYAFEKELIPKIDTDTTLLPYALTASASASATASASASATASASASAIFEINESYTKEHVDFLLSDKKFLETFSNNIKNSNFTKEITDFITYIKLAEYIVNNNEAGLEQYRTDSASYLSDARVYADAILASIPKKDRENPKNFDKIHKANAIILAIKDPTKTTADLKRDRESKNSILIEKLMKNTIEIKNFEKKQAIVFINPKHLNEVTVKAYKQELIDRGGGGDCFYFSVWGCLIDLGEEKYNKITTKLKELGDALIINYVDFQNTFTKISSDEYANASSSDLKSIEYNERRNKFNINIRKLLALYFLIDDYEYENIKKIINENGIFTYKVILKEASDGFQTIIGNKLNSIDPVNFETEFFTKNEFNIILSNLARIPSYWADVTAVVLLAKLLSNCNVILDWKNYDLNMKLPIEVNGTSYIYIYNINANHFQERSTKKDGEVIKFTRMTDSDHYPYGYWKQN